MDSRKRPNEDDAPGPIASTPTAESHALSNTSNTTQPSSEGPTTQLTTEQQEGTKMDIDASSSSEAVPSPTVVAAATLASKEFGNKRVKLTKESEKTGSDYSPSSDIPDPATQSTESKGVQEWMNSLGEDDKEKHDEQAIDGSKDTLTTSSTNSAVVPLSEDRATDSDRNEGSKDDHSRNTPSQTLGQPEFSGEQPSVSSNNNTEAPEKSVSSGSDGLVQALLAPTETRSPSDSSNSAAAPNATTNQTESKTSGELSSSILAVASLSEPMVEAATALEESQEDKGELAAKNHSEDNNSKNLIQLLTNSSGNGTDLTSSSGEEATSKEAVTSAKGSAEHTQNVLSADNSATDVKPVEGDNQNKDLQAEPMQVDNIATNESAQKGAGLSSEPPADDAATAKANVTRYDGDDVIMTIPTGSATTQAPSTKTTDSPDESTVKADLTKTEAKDSERLDSQSQDRNTQMESTSPRPTSPLPPISHGHSLSHSTPRMAASDPNLHERKLSLPETLPPISSLSGAQSLPSLHQPPRSSMSLSAMLINNDEDRRQEQPQPPRMPRNIFDQPPSSSRGASPPPPPTLKLGQSQPDIAPKTEPAHRALPRYSPAGNDATPQQPVEEPRGGAGGIGGKEHPADEVIESGGVGSYGGQRHRPGSASDGRPSPAPGGSVDIGHTKLPSLAAISQPHSAPPSHASSVGPAPPSSGPGQHGPTPPPGRYMPGYPQSHQAPPPHGSAPLPPPIQHAGNPPHHGHPPPPPHHHHLHGPPPSSQQQQHGPPHPQHHAPNGHLHYPGPPQPMMPPNSHPSHYHPPPQRPRLIVKNNENLHVPDRPELFLGYYRYEPNTLLPSMEGKENSLFEVRIASSYLTYDNAKVRKRNLWGTDVYTDDSDVVASLFIPPLSSQSTEQEQFQPQTQQHNFVEFQPTARHLCPSFDLAVTLRVLPRLVKYQGSIRNRIRSRSWLTNHDGMSLKVESIRKLPLGSALNRGRSQSKKRVQENNAERMRVLADTYDDTTESLQNEKALRAATFEFTQQGDPCFKYTPELVMDRHDGLSRKWTSWRLKKEVLILENDEERYEISLQHHAGTDSRRFDRYRVGVISPRTSLSSWSQTTYPLDPSQLVEILYEDLDWQDFEWVERGVVIQPGRYGTSSSSWRSQPPQLNGGNGASFDSVDSAMEDIETAAGGRANESSTAGAAAVSTTTTALNGSAHKASAGDSNCPQEEGVFCLVSRLYWRPMSEKRSEAVKSNSTSSSSAPQPTRNATEKNSIKTHPPSAPVASDMTEATPTASSTTSLATTSPSAPLPSAQTSQPNSTEKEGSANMNATGAAPVHTMAAATSSTSTTETEKEEGELEEGEVAEP
ncbi:hypothetical protein BGW41_000864 [Actinomortierella wolfii]|nr:hypothetical protein BGW41_000864 [Actinomortierella wolfii]